MSYAAHLQYDKGIVHGRSLGYGKVGRKSNVETGSAEMNPQNVVCGGQLPALCDTDDDKYDSDDTFKQQYYEWLGARD